VLRSPSAAMLHRLEIDTHRFDAVGSRVASFSHLLDALPEDLPLRELALGDDFSTMNLGARSFVHLPRLVELHLRAHDLSLSEPLALSNLARLSVRVEDPGPKMLAPIEPLMPLCDASALPALVELSLALESKIDRLISPLLDSPLLDRLSVLRLGYVTEEGAAAICRNPQAVGNLQRFEVVGIGLPEPLVEALRRLGCSVALHPR
jgi:hypothetical protein